MSNIEKLKYMILNSNKFSLLQCDSDNNIYVLYVNHPDVFRIHFVNGHIAYIYNNNKIESIYSVSNDDLASEIMNYFDKL